jgi:hypothetical protein
MEATARTSQFSLLNWSKNARVVIFSNEFNDTWPRIFIPIGDANLFEYVAGRLQYPRRLRSDASSRSVAEHIVIAETIVVDLQRFELWTPSLQGWCSTN